MGCIDLLTSEDMIVISGKSIEYYMLCMGNIYTFCPCLIYITRYSMLLSAIRTIPSDSYASLLLSRIVCVCVC